MKRREKKKKKRSSPFYMDEDGRWRREPVETCSECDHPEANHERLRCQGRWYTCECPRYEVPPPPRPPTMRHQESRARWQKMRSEEKKRKSRSYHRGHTPYEGKISLGTVINGWIVVAKRDDKVCIQRIWGGGRHERWVWEPMFRRGKMR